jgi:hypothetical protein
MEVGYRQPAEVQEILETQDRAELRRAAHKIAYTRMNGGIDAANPFMEADPSSFAPRDRGHDDRPSRHR